MEGSRDSAALAKKKIEKNKPRNRNTKQICQYLYKKQGSLKTVGREGDFHRFVSHLIPDETQLLDFKFIFDNRFNYEEFLCLNQRPIGQTGGRGVPVQRPVVIMVHTPGTERV